jgi:hypothetical protein
MGVCRLLAFFARAFVLVCFWFWLGWLFRLRVFVRACVSVCRVVSGFVGVFVLTI